MHLVVLTAAVLLGLPRPAPEPISSVVPTAPVRVGDNSERVVLTTDDKLTLVGSYWAPKGKQVAPAALLVHDAGGSRQDLEQYAERLYKMGFAVLAIDLRGHGESISGELDWARLDEPARERAWAFATRDLKAAAEFLRDQKAVHSASLVVVGHGSGSTLAARHAVRDENVRALALLAPPASDAQMYGFQLAKDLDDLGGLPTYISVTRDGRDGIQAMASQGQRANGGVEYIQISVFKGDSPSILSDSREASEVGRWLKDKAFPSKGSR